MFIQLFKRDTVQVTLECVAYAEHSNYGYGNGLLYLELKGAVEAMRSVWSNIVKYRKERSLTSTNVKIIDPYSQYAHFVRVVPRTKYHARTKGNRMLIINHQLDRLNRQYLLGGSVVAPAPHFQVTLQQKVDIPFLPEWTPMIWQKALELELVEEIPKSYGIACWNVKLHGNWTQILTSLHEEGKIKWHD